MKTLNATTSKASTHTPTVPNSLTRDLNNFDSRFDNLNCTTECESLVRSLPATLCPPHDGTRLPAAQWARWDHWKAAQELCPGALSCSSLALQRDTTDSNCPHPLEKKATIITVPKKSLQTSRTYLHNNKLSRGTGAEHHPPGHLPYWITTSLPTRPEEEQRMMLHPWFTLSSNIWTPLAIMPGFSS